MTPDTPARPSEFWVPSVDGKVIYRLYNNDSDAFKYAQGHASESFGAFSLVRESEFCELKAKLAESEARLAVAISELREIEMLVPCHNQCSNASIMAEKALAKISDATGGGDE